MHNQYHIILTKCIITNMDILIVIFQVQCTVYVKFVSLKLSMVFAILVQSIYEDTVGTSYSVGVYVMTKESN